MHSAVDPRWYVSFCRGSNGNYNGYYVFTSVAEPHVCLRPTSTGLVLCDDPDECFTEAVPGVQLYGRSHGEFTSTIEYWNDSVNAYQGLKVVQDGAEMNAVPCNTEESMAFSFAKVGAVEPDELHTVRSGG